MKNLLVIIAISVMIIGLVVAKSNAAVYAKTEIFYYADASKTQVVGEYIFTCYNLTTLEGYQTPYYTTTVTPCSGPGCFETEDGCYNDI